ncbi:MAG: hypothetical protein H0S79_22320, partial [Anaerolineaceae bacterium]|nr:hypothetical protein [Anaerolineaceae bacterium]
LWHLAQIAHDNEPTSWWYQLIPVIRQKALGTATALPRQIGQSLMEWIQSGPSADPVDVAELHSTINHWRDKGADLQESPFEYLLLDMARNRADLPRRLRTELKVGFATGEDAIRTLLQSWVNMDWENLPKAFRQVLAWDPDRWGILPLSDEVSAFQKWLEVLSSGPTDRSESAHFIEKQLKSRPQLERLIGAPPWLEALLSMLEQIHAGDYLADLQVGIESWCPWLLGYETIDDTEAKLATPDDETIARVLTNFSQHIKTWSDLDAGLASVKSIAPAFYLPCKQLSDGFQSIFHLNLDLAELRTDCQVSGQPALEESCAVLEQLIAWREALDAQDLDKAGDILDIDTYSGWRILEHTQQATSQWAENTQPCLNAISALEITACPVAEAHLQKVLTVLNEMKGKWEQIYATSPHLSLLEYLETSCDTLQSEYLAWRNDMDHISDEAFRLIYHAQLRQVRAISDTFLKLAQHSRQARLSYASLEEDNALPYTRQLQAGVNLLDHLAAIEAILVRDEAARRFPAWHKAFQTIASLGSIAEQRDAILDMDHSHPLYAWLVQSTLGSEH